MNIIKNVIWAKLYAHVDEEGLGNDNGVKCCFETITKHITKVFFIVNANIALPSSWQEIELAWRKEKCDKFANNKTMWNSQ